MGVTSKKRKSQSLRAEQPAVVDIEHEHLRPLHICPSRHSLEHSSRGARLLLCFFCSHIMIRGSFHESPALGSCSEKYSDAACGRVSVSSLPRTRAAQGCSQPGSTGHRVHPESEGEWKERRRGPMILQKKAEYLGFWRRVLFHDPAAADGCAPTTLLLLIHGIIITSAQPFTGRKWPCLPD